MIAPPPVLAVVATPGSTERLRPLVRRLSGRVDVRSADQIDGRPDGVLVASVDALDVAPRGVPAAVWVNDAAELASVDARRPGDVRVLLSADQSAIRAGAVAVPEAALDVRTLPVLPPLVRARWRERCGRPAQLVVTVGPDADPSGDDTVSLALAAAAVVSGPLLTTALALGTPLVTTPVEAARLGLRDGHEVAVAEPDTSEGRADLARALAADEGWAARCSFAGRRFAEQMLDLGAVADRLLDRLHLSAARARRPDPLARVEPLLAELWTPADAPIRRRLALAVVSLVPREGRR